MSVMCLRFAYVGISWLCVCHALAFSQAGDQLAEWQAPKDVVAHLGERYSDSLISIAPPRDLKKVDQPNPPELTTRGLYNCGWTAGGVFPSTEHLVVALTPFAQPSSDALDKTVAGMKGGLQRGLEDVRFEQVRRGRFNGIEARAGQYTAQIAGVTVIGFYLIGIDTIGTFSVTAMIPQSKATPEKIKELQSSILTFQRVK